MLVFWIAAFVFIAAQLDSQILATIAKLIVGIIVLLLAAYLRLLRAMADPPPLNLSKPN